MRIMKSLLLALFSVIPLMCNYVQQMCRSLLCLLRKPIGRAYYCIWGHRKVIRHWELRVMRTWERSLNMCAGRSELKWWSHFLTLRPKWHTWCGFASPQDSLCSFRFRMVLNKLMLEALDYNTMVYSRRDSRLQPDNCNHKIYRTRGAPERDLSFWKAYGSNINIIMTFKQASWNICGWSPILILFVLASWVGSVKHTALP